MNFRNKRFAIFFAVLIILNILAWIVVFDVSGQKLLSVNFLDVGQGDAIFIETPSGHQILIDGGPDSKILEKLGKHMPFYDRSLDLIILSHPEKDHMAGLIEVLKRYKVENILWTGVVRDTSEYLEWEKSIKKEKTHIFIAQLGQKITAGNVFAEILFPLENLEGVKIKDSNDTSIVAKMIYRENSFLFTGDITKKGEESILEGGFDISSDVLKGGHHGSKTSSSEKFLEKVSPELAVFQVGKENSYGHPAIEVLDRLIEYGIDILRTDEKGDIRIVSDGINFKTNF